MAKSFKQLVKKTGNKKTKAIAKKRTKELKKEQQMKTKTTKKRPAKKVVDKNVTTVGEFFPKMIEDAEVFDHVCYGPDENIWDLNFIPGYWINGLVSIFDDGVNVYGIDSWPKNHKVTLRGDTAEIKAEEGDNIHLFRFYTTQRINLSKRD
jgi:hypothetical protein